MLNADEIIRLLHLIPLPIEGGHFRQTYVASDKVLPNTIPRYRSSKPFSTAIYYLLTSDPDSFSAMHRLPTDEIYHFYLGDPVEMLLLETGGLSRLITLGSDIEHGQHVQFVVPRDVWQGSRLRSGGQFALLGTTMAPGFDASDYEGGNREELVRQYPDVAEQVRKLTR